MRKLAVGMVGAAATAFIALGGGTAWAQADKLGVAASTADYMWCTDNNVANDPNLIECGDFSGLDGAASSTVVTGDLDATTTILGPLPYKVSTSGDLVIDVNLECMLFNEVRSTKGGTEVSTSSAGLLVFAVIDDDDELADPGDPTPARAVGVVTNDSGALDTTDAAPAVRFCSRLVELEIGGTTDADVDGLFVRALIASESTHGFKWVAPDPADHFGTNNLFVSLVGVIDDGPLSGKGGGDQVSGVGFGKRLMTVDSVHLPKNTNF